MKREKWIDGPVLPKFLQIDPGYAWPCATAINSSSVIFFGVNLNEVLIFDLKRNYFNVMPKMQQELYECSAAILHSKKFET